jgi:hypothetical protein
LQQLFREAFFSVGRSIKNPKMLPYYLLRCIAFDTFRPLIPGSDNSCGIQKKDGIVGNLFHHLLIIFFIAPVNYLLKMFGLQWHFHMCTL